VLDAPDVPWVPLVVLALVGLVAAPMLGVGALRHLADLSEWENTGPRDFYVPALVIAAAICFALPLLIARIFLH
jgi:hypothetical protein